MSIIISREGEAAKKLERKSFDTEDKLQQYIYQHPECLPVEEIKAGKKLLILCREFPTTSGPIDAIGIDDEGEVYIIETKLYKNADKRRVIAQILDYGAALHFHFSDFAAVSEEIRKQAQKDFANTIPERISAVLGIEDPEELMSRVKENFENGKFRFIVLMDVLEDRLRDLIRYLNQSSKFDIYGVEIDYYQHEDYQIFIPRLFGAETQKEVITSRTSKATGRWDEKTFFEDLRQNFDETNYNKVERIYQFAKEVADEITWGTGEKSGSFKVSFKRLSRLPILFIDSKQWAWLYFSYINDEETREQVTRLAKSSGINVPKPNFGIQIVDLEAERLLSFLKALDLIELNKTT